jgi:hypothetical protein
VPLRIAVSNILRRVSHNFHPQALSLLKRVRPSRKQINTWPILQQVNDRSWNVSSSRTQAKAEGVMGDDRESEYLEYAAWLRARCRRAHNGCAERLPGSTQVRRLHIILNALRSTTCAFKGKCRTSAFDVLNFVRDDIVLVDVSGDDGRTLRSLAPH